MIEEDDEPMEFQGSRTETNLWNAFHAESSARVKYEFYSSQAKKDGYVQISNIFAETSGNEKEHAELWFKYLNGGEMPATPKNLKDAANGEHMEWTEMYKGYAQIAREEGFTDLARTFDLVASVESGHEHRYNQLSANIEQGLVFSRPESVKWICLNCGYVYEGKTAPPICPTCKHSQAYFQLHVLDY